MRVPFTILIQFYICPISRLKCTPLNVGSCWSLKVFLLSISVKRVGNSDSIPILRVPPNSPLPDKK